MDTKITKEKELKILILNYYSELVWFKKLIHDFNLTQIYFLQVLYLL